MRVPDESKCNKKKEYLIEDRAGYTLCPQCVSCTLNNYTTIYSDGAFYCFFLKKWKRGDDIIEKGCKGYSSKTCKNCRRRDKCENKQDYDECWCNRYVNEHIGSVGNYYYGRRRPLNKNANPRIVEMEARYINGKRADYQRKRAEEDREYQQDKERNVELGYLQISDSDKED